MKEHITENLSDQLSDASRSALGSRGIARSRCCRVELLASGERDGLPRARLWLAVRFVEDSDFGHSLHAITYNIAPRVR